MSEKYRPKAGWLKKDDHLSIDVFSIYHLIFFFVNIYGTIYISTFGWWFQKFLLLPRFVGKTIQFDVQNFSNGLIQPPTRYIFPGSPVDQTKCLVFGMIQVKDSLLLMGKVLSTWTSWVLHYYFHHFLFHRIEIHFFGSCSDGEIFFRTRHIES